MMDANKARMKMIESMLSNHHLSIISEIEENILVNLKHRSIKETIHTEDLELIKLYLEINFYTVEIVPRSKFDDSEMAWIEIKW